MANQLTKPVPIRVGKAVVYAKATAVTVTNSATILSLFTAASDIQNIVKNLVITPPSGEIDIVNLIGETASAIEPTLTFQNYLLEEKAWTLPKISGTLLLDGNCDETVFDLAFTGAGVGEPTGSKRHQPGASDSGSTRVVGSLIVHFPMGTSTLRTILFNNLYITSLGDIKATGADGHLEQDFEGVCSPDNYLDEFKD